MNRLVVCFTCNIDKGDRGAEQWAAYLIAVGDPRGPIVAGVARWLEAQRKIHSNDQISHPAPGLEAAAEV